LKENILSSEKHHYI